MTGAAAGFEMVVGLEVHVQLRTRTKAFCACSTQYGALPNVNTCPICLALPGTLPVLNAEAVRFAVRTALALECTVHPTSVFARKNYFYPDLPKGYQISQYDRPLAEHGRILIDREEGEPAVVGITRLHMEEDAGKSVHDRYPGVTAIDLNRAGVPLIEIVSEPDMRSSREAGAYLRALKQLLEYLDVSDVNMEEGSLRVDANVSARPRGATKLGTKTEVKNMNSFSGVERALEMEFERQCALLARGETVHQQTMLWDGARGEVRPARSKEGSHDYRYFAEPDLPPLILAPAFIAAVQGELPELPRAKRERFAGSYALGSADVDVLTATIAVAEFFEAVAKAHGDPKAAANWVKGEVLAWCNANAQPVSACPVTPMRLAELLALIRDGVVSSTAAKKIFEAMTNTSTSTIPSTVRAIAEHLGLIQERDSGALAGWVDQVFAENPTEAARFLGGEQKLQGVLVGLVMKKSQGRADPKQVNQLLGERGSRGA